MVLKRSSKRNLRKKDKSYRISKKNKKRKNSKKRVNKRGKKEQQKFIGGGFDFSSPQAGNQLMEGTNTLMKFYHFIVKNRELEQIITLAVLLKRKIESDPDFEMEYTKRLEMMSVEDIESDFEKIKLFCRSDKKSELIDELKNQLKSSSDDDVREDVEKMKTEIQKLQREIQARDKSSAVEKVVPSNPVQMNAVLGHVGGSGIGLRQFFGGGVVMFLFGVLAGWMFSSDVLLPWSIIGFMFCGLLYVAELFNVPAQDQTNTGTSGWDAADQDSVMRALQGRRDLPPYPPNVD